MSSVKNLVQTQAIQSGPEVSIPVIDFSLLSSTSPDERAHVIRDLGKACEEWGFFLVVNHGIPENLINGLFSMSNEFFDMPEEEKLQFQTKDPLHSVMVRCGSTIRNDPNRKFLFLRDYVRTLVHPEFHCPNKPREFSDLVLEYSRISRDFARKLLGGISQSLGLEEDYIEKETNLDWSMQIFTANCYPPIPQPESAMGIPPHTDPGLLTFLLQNGVGGLEIKHEEKWVHVNAIPGSIFVNTADQLEIISNGKYKSVWHRAVLNNKKTRISLVVGNGPSPDTIVIPALPLLRETPPAYGPMKYRDYVEAHRSVKLNEKPMLDKLKLH